MKTQGEAEELICPLRSDGKERIFCEAKGCAAWRWGEGVPKRFLFPVYTDIFTDQRSQTGIALKQPTPLRDAVGLVVEDNPSARVPDQPPPRPASIPDTWELQWDEEVQCWFWLEIYAEAEARRRGYCGLAGKPRRTK